APSYLYHALALHGASPTPGRCSCCRRRCRLPRPRRPVVKGTKVSADVLSVDKDTLFPLQAHLGYEITQSLFVWPKLFAGRGTVRRCVSASRITSIASQRKNWLR